MKQTHLVTALEDLARIILRTRGTVDIFSYPPSRQTQVKGLTLSKKSEFAVDRFAFNTRDRCVQKESINAQYARVEGLAKCT